MPENPHGKLPAITVGSSKDSRVCDVVLVVVDAPRGVGQAVKQGIVGTPRHDDLCINTFEGFTQTIAAIN